MAKVLRNGHFFHGFQVGFMKTGTYSRIISKGPFSGSFVVDATGLGKKDIEIITSSLLFHWGMGSSPGHIFPGGGPQFNLDGWESMKVN